MPKHNFVREGEDVKKMRYQKPEKLSLKTAIKGTTMLIMSTTLISHPINIPLINAYFTDKISTINRKTMGIQALSKPNIGSVELFFDIHRFNDIAVDIDVDFRENLLIVSMYLPEDSGFKASDIIIDSVKFAYDDKLVDVSPVNVSAKGDNIRLTFDWNIIEDYVGNGDTTPEFDISGKGAGKGLSGLGERFIFVGHGKTPDLEREYFEQMDFTYYLEGMQVITIPSAEEGPMNYTYRFIVDGRQIPADEIIWDIYPMLGGIEFNSGELVVSSNASEGDITISAQLGSNKYFTDKQKIKLVKVEIEELEEEMEQIEEELIDENTNTSEEPANDSDGDMDEEDEEHSDEEDKDIGEGDGEHSEEEGEEEKDEDQDAEAKDNIDDEESIDEDDTAGKEVDEDGQYDDIDEDIDEPGDDESEDENISQEDVFEDDNDNQDDLEDHSEENESPTVQDNLSDDNVDESFERHNEDTMKEDSPLDDDSALEKNIMGTSKVINIVKIQSHFTGSAIIKRSF